MNGDTFKYYTLVLLLLTCFIPTVVAQNLIVNPSFESFDSCPETFVTQFKQNVVNGWTSPTLTTPDYFNRCSQGNVGVPNNWVGICEPSDGAGYVGLYLHMGLEYKEYIQGSFKNRLVRGEKYVLTFYVSHAINAKYLADQIGIMVAPQAIFNQLIVPSHKYNLSKKDIKEAKKLGKTAESPEKKMWAINPNKGQYFKTQLDLESTEEWQRVNIEFTAKHSATHFIVGNFEENKTQNKQIFKSRYNNEPMLEHGSYVLLDNFSLTKAGSEPTPIAEQKPNVWIIGDVNFEYNSANLHTSKLNTLDSLYAYLNKNDMNILITGHTDTFGSMTYNDKLSLLRAKSVLNYLLNKGISETRIRIDGKGETQPLVNNDSDKNRRINRRVEVKFIPNDTNPLDTN